MEEFEKRNRISEIEKWYGSIGPIAIIAFIALLFLTRTGLKLPWWVALSVGGAAAGLVQHMIESISVPRNLVSLSNDAIMMVHARAKRRVTVNRSLLAWG